MAHCLTRLERLPQGQGPLLSFFVRNNHSFLKRPGIREAKPSGIVFNEESYPSLSPDLLFSSPRHPRPLLVGLPNVVCVWLNFLEKKVYVCEHIRMQVLSGFCVQCWWGTPGRKLGSPPPPQLPAAAPGDRLVSVLAASWTQSACLSLVRGNLWARIPDHPPSRRNIRRKPPSSLRFLQREMGITIAFARRGLGRIT